MIYLNAFLLGGIICLLFQIPLMFTKLGVFKILGSGFVLGAILTALGIVPELVKWGGGGITVMIIDAGELVYSIGSLAAKGNWPASLMLLIIFICVVLVVLLLGILAAMVYLKTHKQAGTKETQEVM